MGKGFDFFEYEVLPDSDERMIPAKEMHTVITLELVLWLLI